MPVNPYIPLQAMMPNVQSPRDAQMAQLAAEQARLSNQALGQSNQIRARQLAALDAPEDPREKARRDLEAEMAEFDRRQQFVVGRLRGVRDDATWQRARAEIVQMLPDADAKLPRQFDQAFVQQALAEAGQQPAWAQAAPRVENAGGRLYAIEGTNVRDVTPERPEKPTPVTFGDPEKVLIDNKPGWAAYGSDGKWYVDGQPIAASRVGIIPDAPKEPKDRDSDPFFANDFAEYRQFVDAHNRRHERAAESWEVVHLDPFGKEVRPGAPPQPQYEPPPSFDQWRAREKRRGPDGKPVAWTAPASGRAAIVESRKQGVLPGGSRQRRVGDVVNLRNGIRAQITKVHPDGTYEGIPVDGDR